MSLRAAQTGSIFSPESSGTYTFDYETAPLYGFLLIFLQYSSIVLLFASKSCYVV
jgi:hypothetical protein